MNRPVSCFALLLLAASVNAQATFNVRVKQPRQGDRRQCDVRENLRMNRSLTGLDGKVLSNQEQSTGHRAKYYEEIQRKRAGDKRPTQLRRYYYHASIQSGDKDLSLPYQKQYVLIRKSPKGQFEFEVGKGEKLEGSAAALLHVEHNRKQSPDLQQLMLPKRPVKLKEAWTIDVSPIARHWADKADVRIDTNAAKGTGRLTRVYKRNGALFGVLSMRVEMPIQAMGAGAKSVRTSADSKIVLDVSLDACIDGSEASGALRASFAIDYSAPTKGPNDEPARVVSSMRGTVSKVCAELPK